MGPASKFNHIILHKVNAPFFQKWVFQQLLPSGGLLSLQVLWKFTHITPSPQEFRCSRVLRPLLGWGKLAAKNEKMKKMEILS